MANQKIMLTRIIGEKGIDELVVGEVLLIHADRDGKELMVYEGIVDGKIAFMRPATYPQENPQDIFSYRIPGQSIPLVDGTLHFTGELEVYSSTHVDYLKKQQLLAPIKQIFAMRNPNGT